MREETNQTRKFILTRRFCAVAFSLLLLAGAVTCAICDAAVSNAFTWSLIPMSAMAFAWLVFFPVIRFGGPGMGGAMAALSVFLIPFLYVLQTLIPDNGLVFPIGVRMAVISLVFLWLVFALFKIQKSRKLAAMAVSLLLLVPTCLLINLTLSRMIGGPLLDGWDFLSFAVLVIGAIMLFAADLAARKKA